MKSYLIHAICCVFLIISCGKTSPVIPSPNPPGQTPEQPPVTPPPPTDTSLNAGLIANYPFNGNADDVSGNNYNLDVNGAVLSPDRFGNEKAAYLFNGSSDFMIIPAMQKADSLRTFTISIWLKTTSRKNQAFGSFVGETEGKCPSDLMFYLNDNSAKFWLTVLAKSNAFNCTWTAISDDIADPFERWTHLVLVQKYVLNPAGNHYTYSSFIDGQAKAGSSSPLWGNPDQVNFGNGGLIGAGNATKGYHSTYRYFAGSIDDVRIYHRALANEEVEKLFKLRD